MSRSNCVACLCLALLTVAACSGGNKKLQMGGTCSLNTDCTDPLVCKFGSCHTACTQTRDCLSGERCVRVDNIGVCQLATETTCSKTQSCLGTLVCASDNICRSACTAATGCMTNQLCVNNICADTTEAAVLTDGGLAGLTDGSALGKDGPPPINGDGGAGADVSAAAGDASVLGNDGPTVVAVDGGVGVDVPVASGADTGSAAGASGDSGTLPGTGGRDGSVGGADAGGGAGAGGGTGGVGGGNVDAPTVVIGCPQTKFGFVAQGTSNPNFHGGVGVRTATQMLVFSAYTGPDPAGTADAGSSPVSYVYVQAFDPETGESKAPAQPLFIPQMAGTPSTQSPLWLGLPSISPKGQIALSFYGQQSGISAAFLDATAGDAGAATSLKVTRQVQLEVSSTSWQPQIIWSNAFNAFVFAYKVGSYNEPIKVRKFFSDGRSVGGDTDGVPSGRSDNLAVGGRVVTGQSSFLGVLYRGYNSGYNVGQPYLTVLDQTGNQVGQTFLLEQGRTGTAWLTGAATSTGYVAFYGESGIQTSFVTVGADGTTSAAQYTDAGVLDGFHFNGTKDAVYGLALNDDVGGPGGVGLAIMYSDNVSFAYVNADRTHVGPATVLAHAADTSNDYINISNSAGSFAVSLWSNAEHMTYVAATTCQ
jgi:hypothetical protein